MDASVLITHHDGLLAIAFNRPEKKNAITQAMYQKMTDALIDAEQNPAIKVIFFNTTGEVFSSGNDIHDFLLMTSQADNWPVHHFLKALTRIQQPVVSLVKGLAIGIGSTLLLHSDLVYAQENTQFCFPFVRLGLCPEAASSYLLPRLIGHQRASEKFLLGEMFDAKEAYHLGLVNQVLAASEIDEVVSQKIAQLKALPENAVQATKQLLKQSALLAQQIDLENKMFSQLLAQPAAQNRLASFMKKSSKQ